MLAAKYFDNGKDQRFSRIDCLAESPSIRFGDLFNDISISKRELFGITSQIRKASVSIAANIVEGYSKQGLRDKMRFFNIAQGSLSECRYYLILINDLKYCPVKNAELLLDEVSRLLNSYRRAIGKELQLSRSRWKTHILRTTR